MTNPDTILDERTKQLASPVLERTVATDVSLVVRVGGDRYAIAAKSIRAVAELRRLTPLPHTPTRVLGLTSRGGVVLPVFDLRAALGLPLSTLPEYGRILVFGDQDDELAVAVEAVEEHSSFDENELSPLPETAGATLRSFSRGVSAGGVTVLDVEALLASPMLVVDSSLTR